MYVTYISEYIYTYMETLNVEYLNGTHECLDRIAPFKELGCYFVRIFGFIVNNLFNIIGMSSDLSKWWDFVRNDEV